MKKINVIVLMGGKSPEYEISLVSGREVVRNLPSHYNAVPVVISRDGKRWQLTDKKTLLALNDPIKLRGTKKEAVESKKITLVNPNEISNAIDVCFIAMHGPFGEDGTVQGMLELTGISYTGSGVLTSALGMDKTMFRKILKAAKIPAPRYVEVKKGERPNLNGLGRPPYFVKPSNQGSSVGGSIARRTGNLKKALNLAYQYSDTALIDEYIQGKEITCAILGNEKPVALPLVEIVPKKGGFFDYESKYLEGGAEEMVPARISRRLTKRIQDIAISVYKEVGCRGFARVDFIVKDNGELFVLEINTIPGLTPMSLFPKAAKRAGISYPKLLEKIIKYALE